MNYFACIELPKPYQTVTVVKINAVGSSEVSDLPDATTIATEIIDQNQNGEMRKAETAATHKLKPNSLVVSVESTFFIYVCFSFRSKE